METYSNILVRELAQDATPERTGLLTSLNQRTVMKLNKMPVFLLRRQWNVQGRGTNCANQPVIYENSAHGVYQTLTLDRRQNSLTLSTLKGTDARALRQKIVVELSSGQVLANEFSKNTNGQLASFEVLDTSMPKRPRYELNELKTSE